MTRSSIDGKPIDRVSAARLEAKLVEEHGDAFASEAWRRTSALGFVEGPPRGDFDGLLAEDLAPGPRGRGSGR